MNKEELAKQYYEDNKFRSNKGIYDAYTEGFEMAQKLFAEYLFNTENHVNKGSEYFITERYLEQTVKFLNEMKL